MSLLLAALLACAAGCHKPGQAGAAHARWRDALAPSAAVPADNPLTHYDKLKLGMSEFDLAQAYNAPQGQGAGFTRVLQRYDAVSIHTIKFEERAGEPSRVLLLEFYRDQLCRIVDRRDGVSAKQAAAWLGECRERYGEPASQPVPGAQWSWGEKDGVLLTLTQDNASENAMSANVVLVHQPTLDAAQGYLVQWEQAHPAKPAQPAGQNPAGEQPAEPPG